MCAGHEEVESFLKRRPIKVLLTGDSHLKSISIDRLSEETKIDVQHVKTYNSRLYYPNARFPLVSIANVLQERIDHETTHIVITAPTSDLTNVKEMDFNAQEAWADLSAKTIVLVAEWCLIHYARLRQVILMDHLPR